MTEPEFRNISSEMRNLEGRNQSSEEPSENPPTSTHGTGITFKQVPVTTAIDHPKLLELDAESIRIFLKLYDAYSTEIFSRAQQLTVNGFGVSSQICRPLGIKYCVNTSLLQSIINLGFIGDVTSYDDVTDDQVRDYLEEQCESSQEVVSLEAIEDLVNAELKMDMKDKSAISRMQRLFISYHMILERNGLAWIIQKQPKLAVYHVVAAIRPHYLRHRIESNLKLSHSHLKKDFKQFLKHALEVAKAFQMSDGYRRKEKPNNSNTSNNNRQQVHNRQRRNQRFPETSQQSQSQPSNTSNNNNSTSNVTTNHKIGRSTRQVPFCPFKACKDKNARHFIKDCTASNDDQKKIMRAQIAAMKSAGGPSENTRSQSTSTPGESTSTGASSQPTAGRITINNTTLPPQPDNLVTISDGLAQLVTEGRCDDGCDDSMVSSELVQKGALMGIGRVRKIPTMEIIMPIKEEGSKPIKFTCDRTWTIPRTVLTLSSGQLALCNISFLVVNGNISKEQLLIGLPVLQHLRIDTRTLLEQQQSQLHETDCQEVGNPTAMSKYASIKRIISNDDTTSKPINPNLTVDYRSNNMNNDPFLDDATLTNPAEDENQLSDAISDLVQRAIDNGFPKDKKRLLNKLVNDHKDIFCLGISASPPANFTPLRIDLEPEAKPIKVRLRNYSEAQRSFLKQFVSHLIEYGMAYANPTAKWASAPLLVPKPSDPSNFRFTVDLRLVNKFTTKHQFPMPNVEQELMKLKDSRCFANFDLSAAYWQLPLDEQSQESQTFITPDGLYSPTRVLHGTTNAVSYLQSSIQSIIPTELAQHSLSWLDDILLHTTNIDQLLECISAFFSLCSQFNLRLHPKKCLSYTSSVRWCGRIIDAEGIKFDPRNLQGLLRMKPPTNGAQLQQFLCAIQWMRSAIPNFPKLTFALHKFMEQVYDKSTSRKRNAVS